MLEYWSDGRIGRRILEPGRWGLNARKTGRVSGKAEKLSNQALEGFHTKPIMP